MTDRHDDGTEVVSAIQTAAAFLTRRWRLILIGTIVASAVALGASLLQQERYTATASLLFRDPGLDQKLFGNSFYQPPADARRQAATNVQLLSLDSIGGAVVQRLSGAMTEADIRSAVTITAEGETDLVTVGAEARDPRLAARVANVVAAEFVRFRRDADRSKVRAAQEMVQRELAAADAGGIDSEQTRALRERSQQLEVLESLQTGNVEIARTAIAPRSPSSPKPLRSAFFGAVIGLLLAIAIAVALDRLDKRLKDPAEIERIFGRPILSTVPASRSLAQASSPADVTGVEREAFRMLRASLRYFNMGRDIRSVVVTSAQVGDGKTMTSWNLAAASAESGARTLLIESDLRRPGLTGTFGFPESGLGLTDVLTGGCTLSDAAVEVDIDRAGAQRGGPSAQFELLLAGGLPPNPADLLDSAPMRELLESACAEYDLVVIDTPPTTVVADAIPLALAVDGVIVVTRLGSTERGAARDLASQLENLGAAILGLVVNGSPEREGRAYAYYASAPAEGLAEPQSDAERPAEAPESSSLGSR